MATAAQPLEQDASAVASATGTATFTFTVVPSATAYTGSLSCSAAPSRATFTAVIGNATGAPKGVGTPWGAWGGPSVFGPIQARNGQTLSVTAAGLTPGALYTLAWRGLAEDTATADLIYPAANSSAQNAVIGEGGLAGVNLLTVFGTANSGGGIFNPAVPSPFRLWSWGWNPTTIMPAWPTSGGVVFQVVNLAGFSGIDTLSFQQGASDNLAGLFVPSPGQASWSNFTNVNLDVYMNYSIF